MTIHQEINTVTANCSPFVWPPLPAVDRLARILAELRIPAPTSHELTLGDAKFQLSSTSAANLYTHTTSASLGGMPFTVFSTSGLVDEGLSALGYDLAFKHDEFDTILCDHERGLILEHVLTPLLEVLEAEMQAPVTIKAHGPTKTTPDTTGAIAFSITDDFSDVGQIAIKADHACLREIFKACVKPHLDSDMASFDPKVTIYAAGPSFVLQIDDLVNLSAGEAFSTQIKWEDLKRQELLISNQRVGRSVRKKAGIILTKMSLEKFQEGKENTVAKPASLQKADGSIPVTISVVIDEMEMRLSEFRGLTSGSVMKSAQELSNVVTLMANGEPFAKANIVRLDDNVAFQITKILQL